MSCYVVSDNTIALVAGIYIQDIHNPLMITDENFGDLRNAIDELIKENYNSYNSRYKHKEKGKVNFKYTPYLDGRQIDHWLLIDASRDLIKKYSIVEKLKILDCYCYNSNEHDGWELSFAKKVTDVARSKLINQLEGYDNAPWGIE